jgi:arthrofactin-type cyclic lipopeptide synthetase B
MVPAAFVLLPALPLTRNGKIDRRALPTPQGAGHAIGFEAPIGEIEATISRIWTATLKVDGIGRHDNFFELGGHSLLAVSMLDRLRQEGLRADVRTLFDAPTVAGLAAALRDVGDDVAIPPN